MKTIVKEGISFAEKGVITQATGNTIEDLGRKIIMMAEGEVEMKKKKEMVAEGDTQLLLHVHIEGNGAHLCLNDLDTNLDGRLWLCVNIIVCNRPYVA